MNTYTWVGPRPTCELCGGPMDSWLMFAEHHTHDKCFMAKLLADQEASLKAIFEKHPLILTKKSDGTIHHS